MSDDKSGEKRVNYNLNIDNYFSNHFGAFRLNRPGPVEKESKKIRKSRSGCRALVNVLVKEFKKEHETALEDAN